MPQQALRPKLPEARQTLLRLPELFCDLYLALMVTFFLLYFDQNGFTKITAAKRGVFFQLSGLFLEAILLWVIAAVCRADTRAALLQELRDRVGRPNLCFLGLLLYLECTLVSALLSPYPDAVWVGFSRSEGMITQFLYVGVAVSMLLFARPKKLHAYLLGATLLVMTVIAVLQVLGGNPFGLYGNGRSFAKTMSENHGFLSTIGNVDLLVQLPCLAIPIFFVAILRGSGKLRFLLILPIWAALYLAVQASVMSAFVGLTVAFLLAFPFVFRLRGKTTLWYLVGLAVLGLLGLVFLYFKDFGSGMLHELHEILHGRFDDSYGSGRFYIWRLVCGKLPDNLWFGQGPDTMKLLGWQFARYDEAKDQIVTASIDTAHNECLNILFHQGILGLAAYLTALGTALVHFFRYAKRDAYVAAFGMAVLCYAVQALFNISQPFVTPLFWCCLGLLEASVYLCRAREYRRGRFERADRSASTDASVPDAPEPSVPDCERCPEDSCPDAPALDFPGLAEVPGDETPSV